MKMYIKGNYRKSIYQNESGYTIGLFKLRETNDPKMEDYINKTITFTGYFHDLNEDDIYILFGEEIDHPRYGTQYQVTEYERVKPEGKDGLIEFLSSDLFPGIGPNLATSIVNVLGENTINKIIESVDNLLLVPKMTIKKANKIYDILRKYEESHLTIVYLSDLGFSLKDALSIYNCYKGITNEIISTNIYQVIDDISDLSFTKIDEIALKTNVNKDDIKRIKACIIYIMNKLTFEKGDTYLDLSEINRHVRSYLKFDIDDINEYVLELENENKIVIENNKYYINSIYQAESNVVDKIKVIQTFKEKTYKDIESWIEKLEIENDIKYNDDQKRAIKTALNENIVIITGGPGTGKTTIIRAITELYQRINNFNYETLVDNIALLAPTGRASKRMSESTSLPATTIHRFLKWNKETNEFAVNEYNKDTSHLIIIDEVSMIDINLLDSLFKGLTNNIKLILVGDYNQLPSVGPGQVLKDLIESDVIPTIKLNYLYRQDEDSYINMLAQEIKDNALSENFKEPKKDFLFLPCLSENIRENIKKISNQLISKGYNYKRVQCMAPIYAGDNGIDNLNKELQGIFNPKSEEKKELILGDVIYRENDKVLQLVNMPDENIFNGDIGVIERIIDSSKSESKKSEIIVDFDGNKVTYTPKSFNKIKHGFIMSIHKSQGSEFEMVIIPVCKSYKRMLYRKLIYTGITRAKKKLILIGEVDAFIYSVSNNSEFTRKTTLIEKLNA